MPKWVAIHPSDPGRNPRTPDPHVQEAQRELASNQFDDFRPGPPDGLPGPVFCHAVHQAKRELGYPSKQINFIYGPRLHGFLSGQVALPKDFKARRRARLARIPKPTVRDNVHAICTWALGHEPAIHYSQRRPILLPATWRDQTAQLVRQTSVPGFLQQTDCSGSTTQIVWVAGGPDPNGNDFSGNGYSGSMAAHGRPVARQDLQVGDIVVFGIPTTHHVAIVYALDADPWLFSHGQEQGPIKIRLAAEAAWHERAGHGGYRLFSLLTPAA